VQEAHQNKKGWG